MVALQYISRRASPIGRCIVELGACRLMLPHCARDLSTHGSVKPCAGSRGCSPLAFCNQAPARKCGKGKGSSEALRGDEAANRPRRLRQTALGTGRSFIHYPSDASLLSRVLDSSWLAAGSLHGKETSHPAPLKRCLYHVRIMETGHCMFWL